MKAIPMQLTDDGYKACAVEDATYVKLNMPGPIGIIILPVIRSGSRKNSNAWTWNGSTEAPTLKPSVLSRLGTTVCHSFVNDGKAQFLPDTTHEFSGQTIPLIDQPAE